MDVLSKIMTVLERTTKVKEYYTQLFSLNIDKLKQDVNSLDGKGDKLKTDYSALIKAADNAKQSSETVTGLIARLDEELNDAIGQLQKMKRGDVASIPAAVAAIDDQIREYESLFGAINKVENGTSAIIAKIEKVYPNI